jgi:hypothetical protein
MFSPFWPTPWRNPAVPMRASLCTSAGQGHTSMAAGSSTSCSPRSSCTALHLISISSFASQVTLCSFLFLLSRKDVFKCKVTYAVLPPVLVIEVPPFRLIHAETFLLHGAAQ